MIDSLGSFGLVTEGSWDWLLGLMRMLGASIDFEFGEHVAGQVVLFRKHSLDCEENQIGWLAIKSFAVAFHLLAMVSVIPSIVAVFEFATRHFHLLGIDDHNILTRIDVGCVLRTVFAHEYHGDFACQMSKGAIGRIDDEPLLLDGTSFCNCCFLLNGSFGFCNFFGSFGHDQVSLSVRNQSNIQESPNRLLARLYASSSEYRCGSTRILGARNTPKIQYVNSAQGGEIIGSLEKTSKWIFS